MTLLLLLTVRTTLVLLAALGVCAACRRRSAAVRHGVLAAGIGAALLMVPLSGVVPEWTVTLPVSSPAVHESGQSLLAVPQATTVSVGAEGSQPRQMALQPASALVAVWLLGVAAGLGLIGRNLLQLARLGRGAERMANPRWDAHRDAVAGELGLVRPVELLVADGAAVGTWGRWRPRVLLPRDAQHWSDDRIRIVLCHELAHVRRDDWTVQLAADVLRALFWFSPLPALVGRRLRDACEQACDDLVLRSGVDVDVYADHLVGIARLSHGPGARLADSMAMARPSTLEERITAMLNPSRDRRPLTARARLVALAAVLLVSAGTSALHLSAQQSGPLGLRGIVYDPSGGVLPAVEMVLENEQGVKWTTPSDGEGNFEFSPVGAGKYVLEASLPGFRSFRQEVLLERATDWRRAITLQVGTLQETITVTTRRPQKPAAPRVAGGNAPVRVGGNIKVPVKLRDVRPTYPESMREAGLEGIVPLEVLVGVDGTVASARVLSAQVHPEFAKAAVDAVRGWVFSPTLLNGVPSEVTLTASIRFGFSD